MGGGNNRCGSKVARGNTQEVSYIPQTEQDPPFKLMLLRLETII